jgi:predicted ATPase
VLKRVKLTNYRCFQNAELELGRLTALVGPNAVGKSSLLAVLQLRQWFNPKDVWRREAGVDAQVEIGFDNGASVTLRVGGKMDGPSNYVWQLIDLNLEALRRPNTVERAARLAEDGGNLPNVISTIPRRQREELAKQFCGLVPIYADVDLEPVGKGQQRLRFQDKWNPDTWYAPEDVSDGTLLLLALLTLQYQEQPPTLLAVEEPEHGLHPYLANEVVALLRKLSEGALGRSPIQVVIATHSPELLEHLHPEEVRFMSRAADGAVTITAPPTTSPEWKDAFAEYRDSLGAAWLSGGMGGVP